MMLLRCIRGDRRDAEGEGRAAVVLAFHGDAAAHAFHESFADRETQARAPVTAADRAVDLGEFLEQFADAIGRNADAGVLDGTFDPGALLDAVHLDAYAPAVGELDRIAHEIQKDLLQPGAI